MPFVLPAQVRAHFSNPGTVCLNLVEYVFH
uniref:Uncharacterized protein n=1 Tax=Anguilla anguilla TaxID=7936 RepID=A0A0E9UQ70_ANGAN